MVNLLLRVNALFAARRSTRFSVPKRRHKAQPLNGHKQSQDCVRLLVPVQRPFLCVDISPWINPGDSYSHEQALLFHRTLRTAAFALGVLHILRSPEFPRVPRYVRTRYLARLTTTILSWLSRVWCDVGWVPVCGQPFFHPRCRKQGVFKMEVLINETLTGSQAVYQVIRKSKDFGKIYLSASSWHL
jgi:hypothetical protein